MCGILFVIELGKKLDRQLINQGHSKLSSRGPDKQNSYEVDNVFMGFSRLAIMDTSDDGLQPFHLGKYHVICNGEIYNYKQLAQEHDITLKTKCDCEIILPLFEKLGFEGMIMSLDAEFAMVIYDEVNKIVYAARDRYGVRPLFFGVNYTDQTYMFASELKALHGIAEHIKPVTPNKYMKIDLKTHMHFTKISYSDHKTFISMYFTKIPYFDYKTAFISGTYQIYDKEYIYNNINKLLTTAVSKRLHTDRPIGFLLSGGLDSSLIVAIATKLLGPDAITCFSIGLENSPDVVASKVVTAYLGIKKHHIIPFSIEAGITAIPDVIKCIESYDITTIRASTPQYLMAKYISQNTDIKVLLSGEGSDEIHGSYRYFRDAPSADEFHAESVRLLEELYMFDNLRTDRTMSGNGLEVRVPFLDFDYVRFIMSLDPSYFMYKSDSMEKQIIRDSFKGYLPDEILYRSKEAFSDAVSSTEVNWFKSIQLLAAESITEADVKDSLYEINKPQTVEALYFRRIFDEYYPCRDNVIKHYWLPRFQKEVVTDPSATVLKCY